MRRGRKVVLGSGAVVLAVASPLAFALGSKDLGDAVSASIVAATAIVALAVPLWSRPADGAEAGAIAKDTGPAEARDGGDANSGARARGTGGPLRAEHTGRAVSQGPGSHANTGVEEAG